MAVRLNSELHDDLYQLSVPREDHLYLSAIIKQAYYFGICVLAVCGACLNLSIFTVLSTYSSSQWVWLCSFVAAYQGILVTSVKFILKSLNYLPSESLVVPRITVSYIQMHFNLATYNKSLLSNINSIKFISN